VGKYVCAGAGFESGGAADCFLPSLRDSWWALLYVAILVFFIWLASTTDILRTCKGGPYSLSNTILLFWTALVIGAYIYLYEP
jgi:hypothetical protein